MSIKISRSGPNFKGSQAGRRTWIGRFGRGVQAALCAGIALAIAAALVAQLDGLGLLASLAALLAVTSMLTLAWVRGLSRTVWIGTLSALIVAGVWWASIRPSNDRDWAADVRHGVTAQIGENSVTLHDVRDFDWTTESVYEPRWEDRTYRLSDLVSVDLVSSAWASPAIAHTIVSFGFSDGRHVAFSAESRRENGEAFSMIGGQLKRYELALIAADERDIIRLHTDIRREWVSIYPLSLTPDVRRATFLSFLTFGNDLAAAPRFYDTLTTNPSTGLRLLHAMSGDIPLDWRILMSGYLADYLQTLGVAGQGLTAQDMHLRARRVPMGPADDSVAFSRRLRTAATAADRN